VLKMVTALNCWIPAAAYDRSRTFSAYRRGRIGGGARVGETPRLPSPMAAGTAGAKSNVSPAGQEDQFLSTGHIWQMCDENWAPSDLTHHFPSPTTIPGKSPLFIKHGIKPVICAPFSRLAHSEHKGPHSDWGGLAQWQTAAPTYIQAITVGDMLQAFRVFIKHSDGRMA
jgi:hypothetical protein